MLLRKVPTLTKIGGTGVAVLLATALVGRVSNPPISPSVADRLPIPAASGEGPNGTADSVEEAVSAQRRLFKEPFDPIPFISRALVASQEGRERDAEAMMRHAVRLDPRSTTARSWLFNLYLREERFPEAVDEASALFRLAPSLEAPLSRTLAILSQLADVRAIIVRRLAYTPYLDAILGAIPAGQFDERALLELAAAVPPESRVSAQSKVIADLLGRKDYAATSRALQYFRHTGRESDALVYDGSFNGKDGPEPFRWSLTANADVRAEAITTNLPGSRSALHVERFSAAPGAAARQKILVDAGRYRLSYKIKADVGESQSDTVAPFEWTITCPSSAKPALASIPVATSTSAQWITTSSMFDVPSTCRLIELSLASTATEFPKHAELTITQVRLDPVGP